MATKKKAENPITIIERLRTEKRFRYRDIAMALKYQVGFVADHTLIFRVASGERECSDDLALALSKLWELEK